MPEGAGAKVVNGVSMPLMRADVGASGVMGPLRFDAHVAGSVPIPRYRSDGRR